MLSLHEAHLQVLLQFSLCMNQLNPHRHGFSCSANPICFSMAAVVFLDDLRVRSVFVLVDFWHATKIWSPSSLNLVFEFVDDAVDWISNQSRIMLFLVCTFQWQDSFFTDRSFVGFVSFIQFWLFNQCYNFW